ncbi:hypothetical protein [Prescottella equi]|uniref:hypothetical protein n=1 Tax=Rhodococcus hoagii TaxID=43767 RepID=UPI001C7433F7|nr:hypothetical protein [Prescottella equi]BCN51557.1 hypothetical protein RE9416_48580 [Prescottella equi]BCN56578.1 hypothetical protein RE9425_49680 [Prescottella equi]BCN61492.1 hypothetical protein RE9427_48620 [Prescottella equi]BCN86295.1 hypothetical protein RE0356_49360 [Prescottella equi]
MSATATDPLTSHYPPNWDARPRVEQWNGHITRDDWLTRDKADLVSIIELLNQQVTNANQNALDASYLAEWRIHRVLAEARIGARIYLHLTRARRRGRKTVRIDELLTHGGGGQ